MALYRDEVRGHFAFDLVPHGRIEREVIGCDLGPVLHLSMSGAHLTPDEARDVAGALIWWADRKHEGAEPDTERLADLTDLLALIPEEGRQGA